MVPKFRGLYTLILILGLVLNAKCQDKYDSLIVTGREMAYNVRFAEAESLFTAAARLEPARSRSYFWMAQIHLWVFLGTENHDEYAIFTRWYDSTMTRLEADVDANPGNVMTRYFLGETYMLRALAGITNHSYIDAFLAVKSASSSFRKALALNPKFYDAYRGLGEIHYFLDFLPSSVRWTVGLFGMEANKPRGFSEVRLAYKEGTLDRVKSALSLEQIYSNYVAEYDSAETLMRWLVEKYPRNPMFNYHLAVVLIKEGRLREAENYLDDILRFNNPDFTELNTLTVFLKGDVHFKLNDFRASIKYNKMFVHMAKKPDYTGIANYRLAICYRAIGDYQMMNRCLLATQHGNLDIYDDAFAKERSEGFLKNGISGEELIVLESRNDIDAGRYAEAYAALSPVANQIQDAGTRAEAYVVMAEAAMHLGKFPEGNRFANISASLDKDGNDWILPKSWYVSAMCNYELGDVSAAKALLRKVESTDEYRRNNILNELVNKLERRLRGK